MEIHSPSRRIPIVNSVWDLSGLRFGHIFPRRGLKLLHWLANEWIVFDSEGKMLAKTHPRTGEFGFHIFHNMEKILPPLLRGGQRCYFEVGNLHADGADALPFKKADTGSDKSNTARIIVRMDWGQVIREVYITEHTRHLNSFSPEATYRISSTLIRSIRGLEEIDFLQRAGYIPSVNECPKPESRESPVKMQAVEGFPRQGQSSRDICNCVIL